MEVGTGEVTAPLYVHGQLAGVIAAQFPSTQAAQVHQHRDTPAAIATLGAIALETARQVKRLNTDKALLLERLEAMEGHGIVGDSPGLHKLLRMVARVAATDTSVLILGESGTGKEMVANALHRQSQRAPHPFVAINCAALTDTLFESELFGHERGAFTGAMAQKKGKLELAEGGSVFLDEIGDLAGPLQAKLLRVLQQREFERVGGTRTLKLDVRLIAVSLIRGALDQGAPGPEAEISLAAQTPARASASACIICGYRATNRDLLAELKRGAFREDLYHRLNVVALHVPPLRERREDIPTLAQHFVARAAARCRRRVSGIAPDASAHLMAYPWPGNIRELENAIERAVVLGESDIVLPEDLPETVTQAITVGAAAAHAAGALQGSVTDAKRQLVLRPWQEFGGDYKQAAAKLNIHPNSPLRLVRTLGLRES